MTTTPKSTRTHALCFSGSWFFGLVLYACGNPAGPDILGDAAGDARLGVDASTDPTVELPPIDLCSNACQSEDSCDNGVDDDCDGIINEDCPCRPGEVRQCFNGPLDRRSLGACTDGVMRCGEFGWQQCEGAVLPTSEICDGQDNDCNGVTDDGSANTPEECALRGQCPARTEVRPLTTVPLRGTDIYAGADVTAWTWSVRCPATVPADLCPRPTDAAARDTQFFVVTSGIFQASLRMQFADGSEQSCSWPVIVRAGGLRVELNWDTIGTVDLDLHVHRYTAETETNFFSGDDCYFGNCKPGGNIDWALPPSTVENCSGAPRGVGAQWQAIGSCRNPRLDIDNIRCDPAETDTSNTNFCAPENINIDDPQLGVPYRVFVHYYSGPATGATYPTLNIYCGGELRGVLGVDPIPAPLTSTTNGWYAADVFFRQGACGVECGIVPVDTIARVQGSATPFGPPWSCVPDAELGLCLTPE